MIGVKHRIKYGITEVEVCYFKPAYKFNTFAEYKTHTNELAFHIKGLAINLVGSNDDKIQYKDEKGKLQTLKPSDYLVKFNNNNLFVYDTNNFMSTFEKIIP